MPSQPSSAKKVELLGRKLRKLRRDRKMTTEDVAASAGIDAQDLTRIERGQTRLGLETLFRLLGAFDVSPSELERMMGGEGPGASPERFRRDLLG